VAANPEFTVGPELAPLPRRGAQPRSWGRGRGAHTAGHGREEKELPPAMEKRKRSSLPATGEREESPSAGGGGGGGRGAHGLPELAGSRQPCVRSHPRVSQPVPALSPPPQRSRIAGRPSS
ncbi:unnamed protein product, partial [Urochloa humidicola]